MTAPAALAAASAGLVVALLRRGRIRENGGGEPGTATAADKGTATGNGTTTGSGTATATGKGIVTATITGNDTATTTGRGTATATATTTGRGTSTATATTTGRGTVTGTGNDEQLPAAAAAAAACLPCPAGAAAPPPPGLADLPEDVVVRVLLHLTPVDVARVSQASRRLAAVCDSPALWERVYAANFRKRPPPRPENSGVQPTPGDLLASPCTLSSRGLLCDEGQEAPEAASGDPVFCDAACGCDSSCVSVAGGECTCPGIVPRGNSCSSSCVSSEECSGGPRVDNPCRPSGSCQRDESRRNARAADGGASHVCSSVAGEECTCPSVPRGNSCSSSCVSGEECSDVPLTDNPCRPSGSCQREESRRYAGAAGGGASHVRSSSCASSEGRSSVPGESSRKSSCVSCEECPGAPKMDPPCSCQRDERAANVGVCNVRSSSCKECAGVLKEYQHSSSRMSSEECAGVAKKHQHSLSCTPSEECAQGVSMTHHHHHHHHDHHHHHHHQQQVDWKQLCVQRARAGARPMVAFLHATRGLRVFADRAAPFGVDEPGLAEGLVAALADENPTGVRAAFLHRLEAFAEGRQLALVARIAFVRATATFCGWHALRALGVPLPLHRFHHALFQPAGRPAAAVLASAFASHAHVLALSILLSPLLPDASLVTLRTGGRFVSLASYFALASRALAEVVAAFPLDATEVDAYVNGLSSAGELGVSFSIAAGLAVLLKPWVPGWKLCAMGLSLFACGQPHRWHFGAARAVARLATLGASDPVFARLRTVQGEAAASLAILPLRNPCILLAATACRSFLRGIELYPHDKYLYGSLPGVPQADRCFSFTDGALLDAALQLVVDLNASTIAMEHGLLPSLAFSIVARTLPMAAQMLFPLTPFADLFRKARKQFLSNFEQLLSDG
ncbi:hypothetical protein DIPPA_13876 [Diplonema papillatum]|nr:hypothetical protein DIPPA_13876 [Diplonema papillatum]|eukprot:gene8268-12757_t